MNIINSFDFKPKKISVNDFIKHLIQLGMEVTDFRPKGNRIERLFLNILNSETKEGTGT